MQLDGVDDYIAFDHNKPQTFTLSLWVKCASTQSDYATMFDFSNGFKIEQHANLTNNYDLTDGDGSFRSSFSLDTNWNFLTFTRDSLTGDLKLYKNAVVVFSTNTDPLAYVGNEWFISKWMFGSRQWSGDVSEVKLWNIARTQSEIQIDMNKQLNGNEYGLTNYWKLNEGSGAIARDIVAGNNGTIYGGTWVEAGVEVSYHYATRQSTYTEQTMEIATSQRLYAYQIANENMYQVIYVDSVTDQATIQWIYSGRVFVYPLLFKIADQSVPLYVQTMHFTVNIKRQHTSSIQMMRMLISDVIITRVKKNIIKI
nr:LamG domain-containing protein [Cohnella sp. WQ 127256]